MCGRGDSRRFRSSKTSTSSRSFDTSNETRCGPIWCKERRRGLGRACRGDRTVVVRNCSATGPYLVRETGSPLSMQPKLKRNWRRCGNALSVALHSAASAGRKRPLSDWAWKRRSVRAADRGSTPKSRMSPFSQSILCTARTTAADSAAASAATGRPTARASRRSISRPSAWVAR